MPESSAGAVHVTAIVPAPPTVPPRTSPGERGGNEAISTSPSVNRKVSILRKVSVPSLVAAPPFRGSTTVTVPFVLTVIV